MFRNAQQILSLSRISRRFDFTSKNISSADLKMESVSFIENSLRLMQNTAPTIDPSSLTISSNKKLPLVLTAHPCGPIPAACTHNPYAAYSELQKEFNKITIHEEVEANHYFFHQYWNAAPYIADNIKPELKSWVAKECDRSPNQPPVIKYGVAMDHLYTLEQLYIPSMHKLRLIDKSATLLIKDISKSAKELKRLAKIEAGLTAIMYPGTYFAHHLEEQFFTKYSPQEYVEKHDNPDIAKINQRSTLLLNRLECSSVKLMTDIRENLGFINSNDSRNFKRRMDLLPLWGMQTQARLPAEDVTNSALEILSANGHDLSSSGNLGNSLTQTILSLSNNTTFRYHEITPESLNIVMFYKLFNALGSRMSEVVLANYRNHIDFICSHILARITAPYAQKHTPGMILAEDTDVLRNMPQDLKKLYTIPYFYNLSKQEGISIFIARSDTTRTAGTVANTEVLASVKETIDSFSTLFGEDFPNMQLILGQGSSPHRGLYNNNDQYHLPFSHPKLSCGVTTQPGPGQYRIANKEKLISTLSQLSLMNATTTEQKMREEMMTPDYINFIRKIEQPGELYFRNFIADPNSWINKAFHESRYSQSVLDRIYGSRWKQQYVGDIKLFNELRAITVFAITKELGFPAHTIIPFVSSMRAYLITDNRFDNVKLQILITLYKNNINYRDYLAKIDECILDTSIDIASSQGLNCDTVKEMKDLYKASHFYLRKISGNKLPKISTLKTIKEQSHRLRLFVRNTLPRYAAIDANFTSS